jgi:predicted O-methyltransferase YrrM
MMKPIIVFPFWSQDEVNQFCWTMSNWDSLTGSEIEYEFLLACRFDFQGDISNLEKLCKVHAKTEVVKLDGEMVGHPEGCNEMWKKVMFRLSSREDLSFAFYMEYDVVPQDRNWLNWFCERWNDKLCLMGHYVSEEWLDNNGYDERFYPRTWGSHINGAACYDCKKVAKILNEKEIRSDMAWDVQLVQLIKNPHVEVDNLTMYEFRLGHANYIRDENLMMVHGAKTMEEKQEVLDDIRRRDLPAVIKQHLKPFNGDTILQGMVYGLLKTYRVRAAVETGSFMGKTTEWLSDNVDFCYGIEVQEEFCEKAKENATDAQVILGSSIEVLPQVLEEIENGPVFFFIDSHWENEWPLLDELRIIGESKWAKNCIIVIHDYKTGNLGYDSYGARILDGNYVGPALDTYFRDARTFVNKDAVGYRRGVLCIISVGE